MQQHKLQFNRIVDQHQTSSRKELFEMRAPSDDQHSLRSNKRNNSHPLRGARVKLNHQTSLGSSNNNSPLRSPKKHTVTFEDDPNTVEPTTFGQPP